MLIRKPLERNKYISSTLLYFTPAVVWGIFVLYFSLMPGNDVPRFMVKFNDKFLHSLIYFTSAGLLYLGFIKFNFKNPISGRSLWLIVAICIVLGGGIEILQLYVIPRRAGEWMDFFANTSGSLVCVLFFVFYHRARVRLF